MQNLKNNDSSLQNWHDEIDKFWHEHSKVSRIYILVGSFCPKYIMFELIKYRGVIFHDTKEWCKIWWKTDLWLVKWQENFGEFSAEHSKDSKLGLWRDPFIQRRKCMSLNFTEELCVMTVNNDAKFAVELTCHLKIGMRNLMNFD